MLARVDSTRTCSSSPSVGRAVLVLDAARESQLRLLPTVSSPSGIEVVRRAERFDGPHRRSEHHHPAGTSVGHELGLEVKVELLVKEPHESEEEAARTASQQRAMNRRESPRSSKRSCYGADNQPLVPQKQVADVETGNLQPVPPETDAGEARKPQHRLRLSVCEHERSRAHNEGRAHPREFRPPQVHGYSCKQSADRVRRACDAEDKSKLAPHRKTRVVGVVLAAVAGLCKDSQLIQYRKQGLPAEDDASANDLSDSSVMSRGSRACRA